jgi:hypothetical protein
MKRRNSNRKRLKSIIKLYFWLRKIPESESKRLISQWRNLKLMNKRKRLRISRDNLLSWIKLIKKRLLLKQYVRAQSLLVRLQQQHQLPQWKHFQARNSKVSETWISICQWVAAPAIKCKTNCSTPLSSSKALVS